MVSSFRGLIILFPAETGLKPNSHQDHEGEIFGLDLPDSGLQESQESLQQVSGTLGHIRWYDQAVSRTLGPISWYGLAVSRALGHIRWHGLAVS